MEDREVVLRYVGSDPLTLEKRKEGRAYARAFSEGDESIMVIPYEWTVEHIGGGPSAPDVTSEHHARGEYARLDTGCALAFSFIAAVLSIIAISAVLWR